MKKSIPIGQFSKFCSITIKALRYYDEIGLLKPAIIDENTGYRYYNLNQSIRAERIRRLRSVDMPIDEIREVLRSNDSKQIQQHLELHRQRIEQQLKQYQKALSILKQLMEQDSTLFQYTIETKELLKQSIVSIRTQIPLKEIGIYLHKAYYELFQHLCTIGLQSYGSPFAIYHDMEFQEENIDIEICIPIENPISSKNQITSRTLNSCFIAYTLHTGSYQSIHSAYQALIEWMSEQEYESNGPSREVYLIGPNQGQDSTKFRTEVQWPIRHKN